MGWYCQRCGHEAAVAGACPRDNEPLARVSTHDLLGRKLGEYTVLATLGGGSFGKVYRAVHERSGLLVAIKLLHHAIDAAESKRVMVEARAAAMLSHPNVAQVYDLGMTSNRRPYIVMQLLEGEPLSRLITKGLPVPVVVSIGNDVLAALGVAHQRGVIHRDLKPDNIFVAKGRAIIVDFGLAKLVADPRAPSLTATGEALGTPHYMAPEQVRGEDCDGRANLYALGCVLFEALTGRPPFSGSATYAVFDAHLHATPPRVRELRGDVPAALDAAIARALEKPPGARFATAAEMQRALAGQVKRRRAWPLAVVLVLVLALGGGITAAVLASGDDPPTTVATTTDPPKPPPKPPGPTNIVLPDPPDAPAPGPKTVPGDVKLTADHQAALDQLGASLDAGSIPHASIVQMRCSAIAFERPTGGVPREVKLFMKSYLALIDKHLPGFDPATCTPGAPASKPTKFPFPKATPDEFPLMDAFEQTIAVVHRALDDGNYTMQSAHGWHCSGLLARDETLRQIGSETRQARSMRRRIDILLEEYMPGSTKGPCP